MDKTTTFDSTTRRLLIALEQNPRATVAWVSDRLRIARGTAQARMAALFAPGVLRPPSVAIRPESLGFGVRAFVTAEVDQMEFERAMTALRDIDEVVECVAVAGGIDLLIQVVARDSDDLYRLGQVILRCPGIRRTATSIVLNELIGYRMGQLL